MNLASVRSSLGIKRKYQRTFERASARRGKPGQEKKKKMDVQVKKENVARRPEQGNWVSGTRWWKVNLCHQVRTAKGTRTIVRTAQRDSKRRCILTNISS